MNGWYADQDSNCTQRRAGDSGASHLSLPTARGTVNRCNKDDATPAATVACSFSSSNSTACFATLTYRTAVPVGTVALPYFLREQTARRGCRAAVRHRRERPHTQHTPYRRKTVPGTPTLMPPLQAVHYRHAHLPLFTFAPASRPGMELLLPTSGGTAPGPIVGDVFNRARLAYSGTRGGVVNDEKN